MITLGNKVRDRVTGFEGIATSRLEYLNGCVQYGVTPKVEEGKSTRPNAEWIDHGQLEVIGEGVTVAQHETGGPVLDAPTAYRG